MNVSFSSFQTGCHLPGDWPKRSRSHHLDSWRSTFSHLSPTSMSIAPTWKSGSIIFPSWFSHRNTVDGSDIQLVYPIVYKVLHIPGGFVSRISEPSTVSPQLNRKWVFVVGIQPSSRLPGAEMVGKLHKSQRNPSTFGGTISGLLTIYFELFVKRTNISYFKRKHIIYTYICIYMYRERGRELVSWFGFLMRWFSGGHCWF